jgi:sugar O-acyltransferase (sialic acid O-acetyltransferase NeuD family)
MGAAIVGAGPYGEVYLAYLEEAGITVAGFLDDTPGKQNTDICGVPVLGTTHMLEDLLSMRIDSVYVPLGHNRERAAYLDRARACGLETPSFIHPSSSIGPRVYLGKTVYINQGVTIQPYVALGDGALISSNTAVLHHTVLGRAVFLSAGVTTAAKMRLGDYAFVGLGATLVSDKCRHVGEGALIGAGSVVVADVESRQVVAGVPARVIRQLDE